MPEWITKYWVEWLFGIIAAGLLAAYRRLTKRIKADHDRQNAMQNGIRALLRDRIIQAYNYYSDKGFCPIYAHENIEEMYDSYHELKGNGTITKLKNDLMDMPTDPPKKGVQKS